MDYYSAIKMNTFESFLMRWMILKPIIQSEVSQKEKHQYSILTHIYMKFREMITMTLYMHSYTVLVFFFLTYFTLYNRLQFHPPR